LFSCLPSFHPCRLFCLISCSADNTSYSCFLPLHKPSPNSKNSIFQPYLSTCFFLILILAVSLFVASLPSFSYAFDPDVRYRRYANAFPMHLHPPTESYRPLYAIHYPPV
jgi:hypothetical protein